ncbi:MAG TPA: hypothetical protein VFL10_11050 [Ornithinibacter sp.]|nr:hypothetical protein [Ornithinibacter sp.]
MGAERWDEQVGSVADEATRLLESLRRSAAEAAAHRPHSDDGPDAAGSPPAPGSPDAETPSGGIPGAGAAAAGPDAAAHDPFCTWCPLCRGAAVVRSLSPETLGKLADLAALAATVLTDLAGSRPAGGAPASTGGSDSSGAAEGTLTPSASRPRPATRARRTTPAPSRPIPVSDADDPQEAPRG